MRIFLSISGGRIEVNNDPKVGTNVCYSIFDNKLAEVNRYIIRVAKNIKDLYTIKNKNRFRTNIVTLPKQILYSLSCHHQRQLALNPDNYATTLNSTLFRFSSRNDRLH